jgi:glycosyltransferase involved in cell wall biosynthesis
VATIHDILYETYPEYFTRFFKLRSSLLIRRTARKAKLVFTVSEYSKRSIVKNYRISPHKITVTYNGVNTNKFFPGSEDEDIVTRRGLRSGCYILSVGRIEPRKNYVSLITGYARLNQDSPPLVIVGQNHFRYTDVADTIHKLSLKGRVIVLNDVGDEELPALYRHARLFVYPSWAEGFGMPILEAMASGVPVICSDTTALPEIAGEAACLIPPGNSQRLSEALHGLLADIEQRKVLIDKGLTQARRFSWQTAAEKTLAGYKLALEQDG